jgi:tRNA threonylcarbamoyladenosine biosynthesis protein TsaE
MLTLEAVDEQAQERIGGALAECLPAGACVVYLEGNLGAGKTTLVRGLLRALGHGGAVKSPTYTLMEPYSVGGRDIHHLDLYRVADAGELEYLGIRDLLGRAAVLLVEWPERGRGELPAADLVVHIDYQGRGRRLTLSGATDTGRAMLADLADGLGMNFLED